MKAAEARAKLNTWKVKGILEGWTPVVIIDHPSALAQYGDQCVIFIDDYITGTRDSITSARGNDPKIFTLTAAYRYVRRELCWDLPVRVSEAAT